jgi:Ca-activated chloride channel homolog
MSPAVHYRKTLFAGLPRASVGVYWLLFLVSVTPIHAFAQQKESASSERPRLVLPLDGRVDDVLRIDTDLVAVDVRVTDGNGRPVRNLRPEDFKLYEDSSERPISFFQVERKNGDQQPVAVVFALDISGSMSTEEMQRLRIAMNVFSSWLAERPSVFAVMSFGMNVRVLQSLTNDLARFDRAFDRLMKESGGLSTHTYDAVDDAIRMLSRKAPRTREHRLMKRVVVVVTDGFPVGDTVAPQTVIERANEAEVSIYTITLPSFSPTLMAAGLAPLPTPLDVSGLVEHTGGLGIYATDKDFAPLLRALAAEVTSSYVLAFYPTDQKRRDGQFHTIRIEAPSGLTARQSRPGFLGNMH